MEFDQFDHEAARYLVHINDHNQVDACARLTPTNQPYLLGDAFPQYVSGRAIPRSENIIEISRLGANPATAPKNIVGQLMAAILEYGLANNVSEFVSLSDIKIIPLVSRFGWQANKIGICQDTGTDISVALSYDVNRSFYENVKKVIGYREPERDQNNKMFSIIHSPNDAGNKNYVFH